MKENKYLELKQDITNTFLKTVSAYANYAGGEIKFGIDDSGKVIGIKNAEKKRIDIENKINDTIIPKPNFTIELNNSMNVITLKVQNGIDTPYLYNGKAYKRNDTSTIEVDNTELRRLIMKGNNQSFDELESNNQRLKFNSLKEKFNKILKIKEINKDILKTLNLYEDGKGYNKAAEILSDNNGFMGVDIAKLSDDNNIFLSRDILNYRSVFDCYDLAIRKFEDVYKYDEIEHGKRITKYAIPINAYREAISNAFVHRTWDVNACVRIAMYEDRTEITSPGGLPTGLSKDEYLYGQVSLLRNPIIGNVFYRLHYIEQFGTGVKRINAAYNDYDVSPRYNIGDNFITIVLPSLIKNSSINANEKIIYNLLNDSYKYSSSELVEKSGFSKNKVVRIMTSLIEKGLAIKEGEGRATLYTKSRWLLIKSKIDSFVGWKFKMWWNNIINSNYRKKEKDNPIDEE